MLRTFHSSAAETGAVECFQLFRDLPRRKAFGSIRAARKFNSGAEIPFLSAGPARLHIRLPGREAPGSTGTPIRVSAALEGRKAKIRALTLLPAAALAVGGALVSTAPANAAASACPSGQLCLFSNTDFGGQMSILPKNGNQPSVANLANYKYPYGSGVNDTASSLVNNTGTVTFLYEDINHGGKYVGVADGEFLSNLNSVRIYNANGTFFGYNTFNDRTSSLG
ncbi:peptidase inhibitor family I36 protein [Streptomyces sp. NPDC059629]|uniref:peptidase inhibitor family I36 protein n=1 Tax=Streptomyces sp. NPDC059629 TaxID=3346889 RepID=UPI0036CCA7E2